MRKSNVCTIIKVQNNKFILFKREDYADMQELESLLKKLDTKADQNILRQIAAIVYRYLEKRERL